jgi:hypothetical protein
MRGINEHGLSPVNTNESAFEKKKHREFASCAGTISKRVTGAWYEE